MTARNAIESALLAKFGDMPFKEVMAFLNDTPAPVAPAPAPAKATRRPRTKPEDVDKVLDSIVELLKEHPSGLRLEGLRENTKLENAVLSKAIHRGLEQKRLTKTGERRTTTYMLVVERPTSGVGAVIRRKPK
jgi:hypothetical protein